MLPEVSSKENAHLLVPRRVDRQIVHLNQTLVHAHVQIDGDGRLGSDDRYISCRLLLERGDGRAALQRLTGLRRCDDIEQVISGIGVQWTGEASRAKCFLERKDDVQNGEGWPSTDHRAFSWALIDDVTGLEKNQ